MADFELIGRGLAVVEVESDHEREQEGGYSHQCPEPLDRGLVRPRDGSHHQGSDDGKEHHDGESPFVQQFHRYQSLSYRKTTTASTSANAPTTTPPAYC